MCWVSKTPGKLSPATNLFRVFDYQSWTMIGVSLLSVSVVLIIITRIGQMYGVETPLDTFKIFSLPLATLIGENLSSSFMKTKKTKKRKGLESLFPPGFAGNGLLLVWNAMAVIITMAFLSNIRAILLSPSYEPPIDSTEHIFKEGRIPIINYNGSLWWQYFQTSNNSWERKAGKLKVFRVISCKTVMVF